jgi:sulfide:quinone oxidoreductase
MAHIAILGAGLGGIPMAFEMNEKLRQGDHITVISNTPSFHFVPSNPWVAVNWRSRDDITVELAPVFKKKGIGFVATGARKVVPAENRVELADGSSVDYDYLVIATGPDLAFDEIEGFGPGGETRSVCHVDHSVEAARSWDEFVRDPGPMVVGAAQGASCFGPAYEFAMIADTDLRRRRIRDRVPITFITSEPYIGHLGLGGVGDTKGLLESALRDRHVKWICNARVDRFADGTVFVTEMDEDGNEKKKHEVASRYTMMLPAFRGIAALQDVEGLVNPRGFVIVDEYQRNPTYGNVFAIGVCIAIPPVETTPVPTGCPKTGYMIETMVTATAHNIRELLDGGQPTNKGSLSAICLADFGDTGTAFVAIPQIPPRNVNWSGSGKWVHWGKIAFEKYFLRKVRKGSAEPAYEKLALKALGLTRLRKG